MIVSKEDFLRFVKENNLVLQNNSMFGRYEAIDEEDTCYGVFVYDYGENEYCIFDEPVKKQMNGDAGIIVDDNMNIIKVITK